MSTSTKEQSVSVSRIIEASPAELFAFLRNPANHKWIDGSNTVGDCDPAELSLGDKFHVKMRMSATSPGCSPTLKYRTMNKIVEFSENSLLAWSHAGGHRWRFQFEEVEGGTLVTETFDWSTSRAKWMLTALDFPTENKSNMAMTLRLLDAAIRLDEEAYADALAEASPGRSFTGLLKPDREEEKEAAATTA